MMIMTEEDRRKKEKIYREEQARGEILDSSLFQFRRKKKEEVYTLRIRLAECKGVRKAEAENRVDEQGHGPMGRRGGPAPVSAGLDRAGLA
jgi:hypothetical protein